MADAAFCDTCVCLSITEDQQNKDYAAAKEIWIQGLKRAPRPLMKPHVCTLFRKIIDHQRAHPHLPRLYECTGGPYKVRPPEIRDPQSSRITCKRRKRAKT